MSDGTWGYNTEPCCIQKLCCHELSYKEMCCTGWWFRPKIKCLFAVSLTTPLPKTFFGTSGMFLAPFYQKKKEFPIV